MLPAEAFLRWLERALTAGVAQSMNGRVLLLPEYAQSVGYSLRVDQQRARWHVLTPPSAEAWYAGVDGAAPLASGFALRLGFLSGRSWLYLPALTLKISPNDKVSIERRSLARLPLAGFDPAMFGTLPHFFLAPTPGISRL